MKRILIALTLTLAGLGSAQTMTARVKPEEPKERKEFTVDPAMKATIDALVVKLGDDGRKVRKQAKDDLTTLGKVATPYLEPYLKDDDVEVRESVKEILAKVDPFSGLEPNRDEPGFFRKRALMKGEKPTTVGERLWLDARKKGSGSGMDGDLEEAKIDRDVADIRHVEHVRNKAAAEAAARAEIKRAVAAKEAAIAKAKAEAEAAKKESK